jgi:glutathione S-transferase
MDTLRLFQFPDIWGRNASPFCLKLEAWLRLAGVPFEIVPTVSRRRGPTGKLPYVEDGGRRIGDSSLVIEHLKASRGLDPDAGLGERQRAGALALQRLIEDHLYYAMVYSRWLDPEGWPAVRAAGLAALPASARPIAAVAARRWVRRMLHLQGTLRHDHETIYAIAGADLEALAVLLGDRPFLMGDHPTTIDATAYGFLANILLVPVETRLKRRAEATPRLLDWCRSFEAGLPPRP